MDNEQRTMNDENEGVGLPTRIMKVIRPCSISRQRALSALGDTFLGAFAMTLTFLSMLWPLLLRWACLDITNAIPIDRSCERTRPAATKSVAPTGIAKQVGLAHLSFP